MTGPQAVGQVLGRGIPLALMTWAAVETNGVLRWLLVAWVVFSVAVHLAVASGWQPPTSSNHHHHEEHHDDQRH